MIVRDAVFSSERHNLGAHAAAAPPAREEPRIEVLNEVREGSIGYEVRPIEPAPLSSERVASWLVTQDGATRTALAAMLSDELAALREAAHAEGYEKGHVEAMTEARDKVRGALAAFGELHVAAEKAFAAELVQLGAATADIVAEVFFKLAGAALVQREAIVGTVTEVLKRVRDERELRIHVNPQDLPLLRSAEAGIAANLPGRNFRLLPDARVDTGGCIVESSLGSLDGRLEVQLTELCATLRAAKRAEADA